MSRSKEYTASLEATATIYRENNASNPGTAFDRVPVHFECYKDAHVRAGGYYFSDGAEKFFNARYGWFSGKTALFVDSMRDTLSDCPRKYRVSQFTPDGQIYRLAEFDTLAKAERFARNLDALLTA